MILAHPLHTFKSDNETHVAAQVEGETLVLGTTRNDEHAAEGHFNLLTVLPLQEAIRLAKALLAAQEAVDEDAWIDAMYERHQDRQALLDSALEHDIVFEDAYPRSIQ